MLLNHKTSLFMNQKFNIAYAKLMRKRKYYVLQCGSWL